jgi:hypothetical protein
VTSNMKGEWEFREVRLGAWRVFIHGRFGVSRLEALFAASRCGGGLHYDFAQGFSLSVFGHRRIVHTHQSVSGLGLATNHGFDGRASR